MAHQRLPLALVLLAWAPGCSSAAMQTKDGSATTDEASGSPSSESTTSTAHNTSDDVQQDLAATTNQEETTGEDTTTDSDSSDTEPDETTEAGDTSSETGGDVPCEVDWQALAVIVPSTDPIHAIRRMAVHEASDLLIVGGSEVLEVYDMQNPETPELVQSIAASANGAGEGWGELIATDTGIVAMGRTLLTDFGGKHLVSFSIEAGELISTHVEDLPSTSEWLAATGDDVLVHSDEFILHFHHADTGLTRKYQRAVSGIDGCCSRSLSFDGERGYLALSYELVVIPLDDDKRIERFDTDGLVRRVRSVPGGQLLGQLGHVGDCDPQLEFFGRRGELEQLGSVPCSSPADNHDGAYDVLYHRGHLLLANGSAGVLDMPWDRDTLEIPSESTLHRIGWLEQPAYPSELHQLGDLIIFGNGRKIGVARMCTR